MNEPDPTLPRALRLARLLDSKFRVPGTSFTFGIDPLLGILPGVGDAVSLVLGSLIVLEAWRLGCRRPVLARMSLNLLVDVLVGSIPVLGDAADFFIKPNTANVKLLTREHQAGRLRPHAPPRPRPASA